MKKIILIGLLLIVLISGCKKDTYTAYKDDIPVLEFQNKPGYLVSTGYFPDEEPTTHPFLDARALTPDYEDELGQIIKDAVDFDEFLELLGEHGYDVYRGEVKIKEGVVTLARMSPCPGRCEEKGMVFSSCGEGPIDSRVCSGDETDVGKSDICVDGRGEGDYKVCCCIEPEKMNIIKVYPNRDLIDEELRSVEIADIFVNNEKGEIIVSTAVEDEILDALMGAIDAAKLEDLILEYEDLEIIDGERVLVLYGKNIEPTDEDYIWSLRHFLSFEYAGGFNPFEFDLVEVSKWHAYTTTDYNLCLPPGVEGLVDEENCKKADRLTQVFEFQNAPGFLTSTPLLPSAYGQEKHPFLTGLAFSAYEEDNLRTILDESSSFVDFLTRLVENEYVVISEDGESQLR